MIIVFEWLDGAWKDTQLQNVFKYLTEQNKYLNIWKTQEPSGFTPEWIIIREKLKNWWFQTPEEALELYILDRIWMARYKRLNSSIGVVLVSRGDYTTYAYQSLEQNWHRGFSFDEIYKKHKELDTQNELVVPDITFFFDLPTEVTMERIKSRLKEGEKTDFFEKEEFLREARKKYLEAIEYLREKENRNIFIINANKSREEIFEEIKNILDNYLKDWEI